MSPRQPIDGPAVKGASLVGFLEFIRHKPYGPQNLESVKAALGNEASLVFARRVISVADYPYAVFVDLIRAIDKVMGRGDFKVCKELGRFAGDSDVKLFRSLFNRDASVDDVQASGELMWRSYHLNSGELKVVDKARENTVIRILDFPQMDPAHCALMEGWISQACVAAGVRWIEDIRESACMNKGDSYHEFKGKWRPA